MTEFIRLPQLKIFSEARSPSTPLMFVSGGRPPTLEWLLRCGVDRVWCIDCGIDTCRRAEIVPELLIGDLDSARRESIEWARARGVPIERYPIDKDLTDTQLAFERAVRLESRPSIVMTGAFGGRLDHLYATMLTCAHLPLDICLADQSEVVSFVRSGEAITLELDVEPSALSLLPMTDVCRGVSIDGVHWTLDRAELLRSSPNAISNRVEARRVNVAVEEGILAVVLTFEH